MEEGFSASHVYKQPGVYTISCRLMDIDRNSYENVYKVDVVVLEAIPTILRFAETSEQVVNKVSKITKVASIEALQAASVGVNLNIVPTRTFDKDETKEKHYREVESTISEHYWAFYENTGVCPAFSFNPVEKYTPEYQEIFGKFSYDLATGKRVVELKSVLGDVTPDDKLLSVNLVDPEASIPESGKPYNNIQARIQRVFSKDDIPDDYYLLGRRAFVDIYYKSDVESEQDKLFISYDFESQKPYNEVTSVANYVNNTPLGLKVKVEQNTATPEYALSLNGFLHDPDADTKMDSTLAHSFFDGLEANIYHIPHIRYTGEDFGVDDENFSCTPFYYLPKDVESVVRYTPTGKNTTPFPYENTPDGVTWYNRHIFAVSDFLHFNTSSGCTIMGDKDEEGAVRSMEDYPVPHEIYHREDSERIINALTPHRAFGNAPNVREAFRVLFNNDEWLDKSLTKVLGFFDDTVDVDKCHVDYLVSILHSMNENTDVYSDECFNAVNEIRDFARIASMNHSMLVGHEVSESPDISFNGETGGKNIGNEIYASDVLFTDEQGYVAAFNRDGKFYRVFPRVPLVVYDKGTRKSFTVNFHNITSPIYYDGVQYIFDDEYGTRNTTPYKMSDYSTSWGWNLLLPDRYYLEGSHDTLIDPYYRFFLYNPATESTRIGNYLEAETITDEVADPVRWDADWGTMYKMFHKLIVEHGLFIDDKGDS